MSYFNMYGVLLECIEQEVDREISFPDLEIIVDNNISITTDWYYKPTYSGHILNFQSNHPKSAIFNIAKNLIKKAKK